jgi:hypothetical protein
MVLKVRDRALPGRVRRRCAPESFVANAGAHESRQHDREQLKMFQSPGANGDLLRSSWSLADNRAGERVGRCSEPSEILSFRPSASQEIASLGKGSCEGARVALNSGP